MMDNDNSNVMAAAFISALLCANMFYLYLAIESNQKLTDVIEQKCLVEGAADDSR